MKEQFIVDDNNKDMFDVFCNMHPHESYELNPQAFIRHCKEVNPYLTEKIILELLKETKEDENRNKK